MKRELLKTILSVVIGWCIGFPFGYFVLGPALDRSDKTGIEQRTELYANPHAHKVNRVDVVERDKIFQPDTITIQIGDTTIIFITIFEDYEGPMDITPPVISEMEIGK